MELYLDSADLTACRTWLPTGLFHGVTTNLLILKRDGMPCRVAEVGLLALGAREVQVQPWGDLEARRGQIAAFSFGRLLARTTLLRLSRADLDWLRPDEDEAASARALLRQGPALIVVTGGEQGSSLYSPGFTLQHPAFQVEVATLSGRATPSRPACWRNSSGASFL